MTKALTTYAQNREDFYIFGILHQTTKGFYVDVGANHEKLHSVTRMFYELGWSGINIEPNSKLIGEFKRRRRRDINLQYGVSDKKGKLKFREYPDFDGLSTVSEEIMAANDNRDMRYEEYDIPVKTLAQIFTESKVTSIDFLKVDIEGHELHALMGNDWKKYRPKLVVFEGTKREQCIDYMSAQNYRLEFFDGLNYYMIDNAQPDLTIHSYAGAVLSRGLYTSNEVQLIKEAQKLKSGLQKLEESIPDRVREKVYGGAGIKDSLISLTASVRNRASRRRSKA